MGEDPYGPVRFARPLVGEHEGHPLLLHLGNGTVLITARAGQTTEAIKILTLFKKFN